YRWRSIAPAQKSRSTAAASASTPKWFRVLSTNAWAEPGSARRSPSREREGTLPGFPDQKARERMSAQQLYPDDLFYTKDHEWARLEERDGQKLATIGVTRFAVDQLGDVTQVDLPKEGETVKQAEVFGSVESGKVVKVNSPLADSPEYVNEDPYDEGWMIQVAVGDSKELDGLLDAAAYQAFVREQGECGVPVDLGQ